MSYRSTSICMNYPCVLIEGSCYWSLAHGPAILAFDLDSQSLNVIHLPLDVRDLAHYDFSVVRMEGGRLGFFVVPGFSAQLWKWNSDCDGAASWVLERSIELDKLLSLNPDDERERPIVAGFAEDNNVVLLWAFVGVLTLQLKSLHSKKLFRVKCWFCCLPFEGVYTAGETIPSYFILLDYYC
uniref:F-box protein AT5G49610-like beta-propeller domain-containing protein n=1 Tax=Aegilops tauschii subsp. strangulata TaxID=200361 RepID=A0A453MX28_AEGTS